MSDPAAVAERQQRRQQGWIAGLIGLPFRLFGMLCGSLVLAILLEWIGMLFIWSDQGSHHAERMLSHELDQLSSDFRRSIVMDAPVQTARRLIKWTHEYVVIKSGLREWIELSRNGSEENRAGLSPLLKIAYDAVEQYTVAAGYTALTFLVRLVVLCLALPLFLSAAFVGLVDGLVRRDLRRFGAGRESGFLYHRARMLVLPLAVLPWLAYPAIPVAMHPLWILLPTAIPLCISVNVTVGSFKKYL
jgi:integrating conjugative element membrane protein (TIGR03747 family)